MDFSESQQFIEEFLKLNVQEQLEPKKRIKKKHKKKAKRKYKSGEFPKVLVIFGETLMIRDYIMNDLKYQFNLSIQAISGSKRRDAKTFKLQLFDASQCNAAYKESQK